MPSRQTDRMTMFIAAGMFVVVLVPSLIYARGQQDGADEARNALGQILADAPQTELVGKPDWCDSASINQSLSAVELTADFDQNETTLRGNAKDLSSTDFIENFPATEAEPFSFERRTVSIQMSKQGSWCVSEVAIKTDDACLIGGNPDLVEESGDVKECPVGN